MRPRVVWWCAAALLTGCSFNGGGLDMADDAPPDADPTAFDAAAVPDADPIDAACGGAALSFAPANVAPCAIPVPMGDFAFPGNATVTIDTADGSIVSSGGAITGLTTAMVTQTDGATAAMVIVADDLTIPSNTSVTVIGNRPLIVVALGDLIVSGTLDASGTMQVGGPGAGMDCATGAGDNGVAQMFVPDSNGEDTVPVLGGAGGGGGAFGSDGGNGAAMNPAPTAAPAIEGGSQWTAPGLSPLRGGCKGGTGGVVLLAAPTAGGGGGGALELIGGASLTITGVVSASGGGGTGAASVSGGGGGGGSGGAILLQSPLLAVNNGKITANGGAGGEGRRDSSAGGAGDDGHLSDETRADGGEGAIGGDGGDGGATTLAGDPGLGGTGTAVGCGGGGGGGGVGRIHVRASTTSMMGNGLISPAATSASL